MSRATKRVRELCARVPGPVEITRTAKGHLRLRNPITGRVVFAAGTPSDWRADRNATRQFARRMA